VKGLMSTDAGTPARPLVGARGDPAQIAEEVHGFVATASAREPTRSTGTCRRAWSAGTHTRRFAAALVADEAGVYGCLTRQEPSRVEPVVAASSGAMLRTLVALASPLGSQENA
jgi:hypothetical protein